MQQTLVQQTSPSRVRATRRRHVMEVWDVFVEIPGADNPHLSDLDFDIECRRGTFLGALREYLRANGIDSELIEQIIDGGHVRRDLVDEYRVPEQPLFTTYQD